MQISASCIWAALSAACVVGSAWAEDQIDRRDTSRNAKTEQTRARGERIPDKLKVGDVAPDFTLKSLDGPETTTLSDFRGKRPVVLIFGSYT